MDWSAFVLALSLHRGGEVMIVPVRTQPGAVARGGQRVLTVDENGILREAGGAPAAVRFTGRAPMPAGWVRHRLVVHKGETVVVRAANGRKIKSLSVDREGLVEARALDPYSVQLTGLGAGIVRLSVKTD